MVFFFSNTAGWLPCTRLLSHRLITSGERVHRHHHDCRWCCCCSCLGKSRTVWTIHPSKSAGRWANIWPSIIHRANAATRRPGFVVWGVRDLPACLRLVSASAGWGVLQEINVDLTRLSVALFVKNSRLICRKKKRYEAKVHLHPEYDEISHYVLWRSTPRKERWSHNHMRLDCKIIPPWGSRTLINPYLSLIFLRNYFLIIIINVILRVVSWKTKSIVCKLLSNKE